MTWNAMLPGAVVAVSGGYELRGTDGQIAALLASLGFVPPTNFSGTVSLTITTLAREAASGTQVAAATASDSDTITISVVATVDPIALSDASSSVNEDAVVTFGANLPISLADLDNSQNVSVTLSGIPAGVLISHATIAGVTVVNNGGGSWTVSGANAANAIAVIKSITIPLNTSEANRDNNFTVSISATTTEVSTGQSVTTNAIHDVIVRAVADVITIGGGVTFFEDPNAANTGQIGDNMAGAARAVPITVALTDTDGSETIAHVDVRVNEAGGPTGGVFGWNTGLPGTVANLGGGVYRFDGTDSEIQALLASITYLPPVNRGTNVIFEVTAVSVESNPTSGGEIAQLQRTSTANVVLDIVPVSDTPTVTAPGLATPFMIEEDTPSAITGLSVGLTDTDGSEVVKARISFFTDPGFASALPGVILPAGTGGVAVTNLGGGLYEITGPSPAAINAYLGAITVQGPTNYHGEIYGRLTAISTELENGSTTSSAATFRITIDAQADAVTIGGASAVNEDAAITFGGNITLTRQDGDGSESIVEVRLSSFPAGVTPNYAPQTFGGATAAVSVSAGVYTITAAGGTAAEQETAIRNTLNSFALTPSPHDDYGTSNISLVVQATTRDADGSTLQTTGAHAILVRAVADAPDASAAVAQAGAGNEDGPIIISGLSISPSADTDLSERLSAQIILTDAASNPLNGAALSAATAGVTVVNSGGGIFTITAASADPVVAQGQINSYLASLSITPPTSYAGVINGTLRAISTEQQTGAEVAVAQATDNASFTIRVHGVADTPDIRAVDATGTENSLIKLGISSSIGTGLTETLEIFVTDIPPGAQLVNGSGVPVGVETAPGSGIWKFTPAQLADLHVRPPPNSNVDFTLRAYAVATETVESEGGGFGSSQSPDVFIGVNVIGVANTPTFPTQAITISEPIAGSGTIPLGASITGPASSGDNDGSETISYFITGLPPGVVPSVGSFVGGGWQVSAADLPLLTIPAPPNFSGEYNAYLQATYGQPIRIVAVAQENDGDQRQSAPFTPVLNITPSVDAFTGWAPGITVTEDDAISLAGVASGIALIDNDGSEAVVSYRLDFNAIVSDAQIAGRMAALGFPATTAGFIAHVLQGAFTDNGDGTVTVTPAQLAALTLRSARSSTRMSISRFR